MNLEKLAVSAPAMAKALGKLKKHFTRGVGSLDPEVRRGFELRARQASVPDSLVMWPLVSGAKMVAGKRPVDNFMWKKFHRPALSANIAAGNVAHDLAKHVPGLRKLFLEKHKIPVRRGSEKLYREVDVPSATAPLTKARNIAVPFAVGLGANKALSDVRKSKKDAVSGQVQGVE